LELERNLLIPPYLPAGRHGRQAKRKQKPLGALIATYENYYVF